MAHDSAYRGPKLLNFDSHALDVPAACAKHWEMWFCFSLWDGMSASPRFQALLRPVLPSCAFAWDKPLWANRGLRSWGRNATGWCCVCQSRPPRKLSAFALLGWKKRDRKIRKRREACPSGVASQSLPSNGRPHTAWETLKVAGGWGGGVVVSHVVSSTWCEIL